MALLDHEYAVPDLALFLQDHNYGRQQNVEKYEEPLREKDEEPLREEDEEPPSEDVALAVDVMVDKMLPGTYRTLPGIRRNSTIYIDNFKYKYYKREAYVNVISLVCERQKNPKYPICFGSASISTNISDNRIFIRHPHNHLSSDIDLHVLYLGESIGNNTNN